MRIIQCSLTALQLILWGILSYPKTLAVSAYKVGALSKQYGCGLFFRDCCFQIVSICMRLAYFLLSHLRTRQWPLVAF